MPVEVELKYLAADGGPLRNLERADRLGPARLGPATSVDEVDRYLDTPAGHLAAARWACRLRTRDGSARLSLKGPPEPGTGGSLHRRPEVEGPAAERLQPSTWPASAARDLLDELRAGEDLVERLRLTQRRRERDVLLEGTRIGILSLDEVEVEAGGRPRGRLHAVELEVADGQEAALAPMTAALGAIRGLEPDGRTKLEHALALIEGR